MHTTGRLKKLKSLVQTKKGHQSGAGKGKRTSENDGELLWIMLKKLRGICSYEQ